jgi:hypothetical protein
MAIPDRRSTMKRSLNPSCDDMEFLSLALATAFAGLKTIRRDSPPRLEITGDEEDRAEDNTFGLPDGLPIKHQMQGWFGRQMDTILGHLPTIGAPLPATFPSLANYDDPMASAMTPILSLYWDEAGQVTRGKLGLDPDEWSVVDVHTQLKIRESALEFCHATNATTSLDLATALGRLREEFVAGIVTHGESIPELRKRVQSVFTKASDSRAETIARTEASRAVHAGSLESAKSSGVVAGKAWLLSANACPICFAIRDAEPKGGVPLDGDFGQVGTNATYRDVRMPPAHPHCRCSTTYVLTPEYEAILAEHGPKYDRIEPGPLGPEPKKRKVATPKPKKRAPDDADYEEAERRD